MEHGAHHAEGQHQAATPVVGDQIQRRRRRATFAADRMQRAGERQVVEIMACGVREWAFLAEAGHAAVDEFRIVGQAYIRTEAEPLHRLGTESFNERICPRHNAASQSSASPTL